MKTILLLTMACLACVGCDDQTALKLSLAEQGRARVQKELLASQAEARKYRVRISELELEIAKLEGELSAAKRTAKQ
jgi:septal ring factor EnvC (AmiA/AmiB activator)